MARCILDNLTPEQAETMADWFEGQGEQDAQIWFDAHEVPMPWSDLIKPQANGDVIVTCKVIG